VAKKKNGCVATAAGPLISASSNADATVATTKEVSSMQARVGAVAPDFEATAYMPDKNDFTTIKLSDYKGKWITLCFYPGDFTFV
jgi:peroxiredoxin (alkyl hydroperoxide reductase subunit C)